MQSTDMPDYFAFFRNKQPWRHHKEWDSVLNLKGNITLTVSKLTNSYCFQVQAHSLQSGPLALKKKLVIMLVINIFQVSCHSQVTEYGIHSLEYLVIFVHCDKL